MKLKLNNFSFNIKLVKECLIFIFIILNLILSSCAKKKEVESSLLADSTSTNDPSDVTQTPTEDLSNTPTPTPTPTPVLDTHYIYLSSGTSYAGLGVTLSAPSQVIAKYDISGKLINVLRDFTASQGDSPVALLDYNPNYILALIENSAGRRVEMIAKDGSGYSSYLINSNLNSSVKDMIFDYTGGLLISKSTSIEKITSSGTRISIGGNPYVNNPAGSCTASATNISKIEKGPDDTIIFAHAFTAASVNNRINLIAKTGYSTAVDCLASIAAPTINHFPTAMLYHSSGKLLVAYGNNTGAINQVYSYDITNNSIANPILAYNDLSVLQGISEIVELPDHTVLITSASSSFNTVEKFQLDSSSGILTHLGTIPFLTPSIFTRSISSIIIAD